MIKESYAYIDFRDYTRYYFQSEGHNGKITKIVMFSSLGRSRWNLGFGDLKNGDIDDSIVSNNHDLLKVISTVAKITYEFSDKYPSRRIIIKPVDEKRKKLYNHVFRRNYNVINATFDIIGVKRVKRESYSPENFYDHFELNRKFGV